MVKMKKKLNQNLSYSMILLFVFILIHLKTLRSCSIEHWVLCRKEQFFSYTMEKQNQIIVLPLSRVINEDRMK